MKKAKAPKHVWAERPDSKYLRYCTACGVYEDEITLTSQTLHSMNVRNVKVFRPYKQPTRRFEGRAQPPCRPLESGPAEAPPPFESRMGDAISSALAAST